MSFVFMLLSTQSRLQTLATLEFDRNRKSMSTIARRGSKNILLVKVLVMNLLRCHRISSSDQCARLPFEAGLQLQAGLSSQFHIVQGAAECVLERCTHVMREDGAVKPLTAGLRQTIETAVEDMAKDALRCLVAAQKVSRRPVEVALHLLHLCHPPQQTTESYTPPCCPTDGGHVT